MIKPWKQKLWKLIFLLFWLISKLLMMKSWRKFQFCQDYREKIIKNWCFDKFSWKAWPKLFLVFALFKPFLASVLLKSRLVQDQLNPSKFVTFLPIVPNFHFNFIFLKNLQSSKGILKYHFKAQKSSIQNLNELANWLFFANKNIFLSSTCVGTSSGCLKCIRYLSIYCYSAVDREREGEHVQLVLMCSISVLEKGGDEGGGKKG